MRSLTRKAERGAAPGAYTLATTVVLVLAAVVRVVAALRLPPHVDESASILAAKMVVEDGIPRFPSGLMYTQGASLSYLLAPIVAAVEHPPDHVFALRLISVAASTAAVFALARLALAAFGSPVASIVAALLLAVDPTSVRWSGHVRMYALLQLLGVVLAWMFVRACARPVNRRIDGGFVVLGLLAAFTHLAALLYWPAFAVVAAARFRTRLLHDQRGLAISLGLASLGPILVLAINRLVRPPGRATSDALGQVSFVGDHLIDLDRYRDPSFSAWKAFFADLPVPSLGPWIMVGVSGALLVWPLLARRGSPVSLRWWETVVFVGCYWGPILFVAYFFGESHDRYLLHVQAVGLLMVGGLVGWSVSPVSGSARSPGKRTLPGAGFATRLSPGHGGPGRPFRR